MENTEIINSEEQYTTVSGSDIEIEYLEVEQESNSMQESVQETTTVFINLSDFSLWRSGMYSPVNGQYQEYGSRLCTLDYIDVRTDSDYELIANIQSYNATIYELSESNELINVKTYSGNSSIKFLKDTVKIGISLRGGNDATYEDFKSLFSTSGFYFGLSYESSENLSESNLPSDSNQTVTGISGEDLKSAFSEALDEYFSNEYISVVQVDDGINKKISEFTLPDICLVIIAMAIIAQGILKIIGGKAWNK